MRTVNKSGHRPRVVWVSATTSRETQRMEQKFLRDPRRIDLTGGSLSVPSVISHYALKCVNEEQKKRAVPRLLAALKPEAVLVFASSKERANKLATWLQEEKRIPTVALINDGRSNRLRARAIDRIERGLAKVLVATEMAARGLDIQRLSHVINYDLPMDAKAYLHRVGRVGRFNSRSGVAISLPTTADETQQLSRVEKALRIGITEATLSRGVFSPAASSAATKK